MAFEERLCKKDLQLFKKIFSSSDFRPDQLKIYPCQIILDSPLEKIYKSLRFQPYSEDEAKILLEKMLKIIPEYCRVMRIMREFPKEKLVSGLEKLGLRKDIEADFRKKKIKINEIRMREIGFNNLKNKDYEIKLKILEYNASKGKEFFLEFVNEENILFGLLRLRISDGKAIVRELHVYGQAINLGEKGLNKKEGYARQEMSSKACQKETFGVFASSEKIHRKFNSVFRGDCFSDGNV